MNDELARLSHPRQAELGKAAFKRHQRIVDLRAGIERDCVELGRELYELRRHKEWRLLGYDSFEAYIATPEVNMSKTSAYRFIRVYAHFVLYLKCSTVALVQAGISKLDWLISHTTPDNADEFVTMASAISRSDLLIELGVELSDNGAQPPAPEPDTEGLEQARQEAAALRRVVARAAEVVVEKAYAEPEFDALVDTAARLPAAEAGAILAQRTCPECGHEWSEP